MTFREFLARYCAAIAVAFLVIGFLFADPMALSTAYGLTVAAAVLMLFVLSLIASAERLGVGPLWRLVTLGVGLAASITLVAWDWEYFTANTTYTALGLQYANTASTLVVALKIESVTLIVVASCMLNLARQKWLGKLIYCCCCGLFVGLLFTPVLGALMMAAWLLLTGGRASYLVWADSLLNQAPELTEPHHC